MNDGYEERICFLQGILDSHIKSIHKIEDQIEDLTMMEYKLDHLEQYSRRNSVRITPEKKDENTDEIVIGIAQNELGITLKPDRSHRVGPRGGKKPRPIIAKFVSYKTKRKLYQSRNRSKFSGNASEGTYINEDLTKVRQNMFTRARLLLKEHLINDCWTDGNIFVREFNSRIRVFSEPKHFADWIENLKADPPKTYAEVTRTIIV